MTQFFQTKDPAAVVTLSFDCSGLLATGETITSASIVATTVFGTDTNPSAILSGLPTISGTTVKQVVQGGLDGRFYNLKLTFVTSLAATQVLEIVLPVNDTAVDDPSTAPSEAALVTVEKLKRYLDPSPPGNTADQLLTDLISRASSLIIDEMSNLTVANTSYVEVRSGIGNRVLVLRHRPAQTVASVTIDTTVIPQSVSGSSGWLFDQDSNCVRLIDFAFNRGTQNVTIAYTAFIPAGHRWLGMLEHACITTCALWWRRRAHIDQTSIAAPSGMGSINFTQSDISAEAKLVINQLRTVAPRTP